MAMNELGTHSCLTSVVPEFTLNKRLSLHRSMLRIRRVEESIAARYSKQEMRCPTHLCIGQEATPVAVSDHLRVSDYAFSGHRSHGHYLAKGGSLKAMLAELFGRETGCALGRGGSQHLIDLDVGFVASAPILAGTIPIGVGAALGARLRGEDRLVAIYFGDGAVEEGGALESFNFASVQNLPVLFVCENNLYSVHSTLDVRQPPGRPISKIAEAFAMPGVTVDGNDVEQIWRVAGEAAARARRGEGPTLIETMTYRWLEHCGPLRDEDIGYRTAAEVEQWIEACPIKRSESRLRALRLYSQDHADADEIEVAQEIAAAFDFALRSPFPDATAFDRYTIPKATGV
jgi:TPP-dependent pyruvate/acetoin dehydrogenase alpha subunit